MTFLKPASLLLFTLALLQTARGQFYYKDLVTHRQNLDQYQLMRKARVAQVTLTSFEGNGERTEDFSCEQSFNNSYSQLKTLARAPISGQSITINQYNTTTGLIYRTVDSSAASVSIYDYAYDSLGRLAEIRNSSGATGEKSRSVEVHQWTYDASGHPLRMLKLKDQSDSTLVTFKLDAQGNVTDEITTHRGVERDHVYYYYDDKNRLTDLVRYNERLKKLVPDYYFNYDDEGRISEMVTLQGGSQDRLDWRYAYDEKGLKTAEKCYDRNKTLLGRIEYSYNFRK
jgi:YD repeat-containing protein